MALGPTLQICTHPQQQHPLICRHALQGASSTLPGPTTAPPPSRYAAAVLLTAVMLISWTKTDMAKAPAQSSSSSRGTTRSRAAPLRATTADRCNLFEKREYGTGKKSLTGLVTFCLIISVKAASAAGAGMGAQCTSSCEAAVFTSNAVINTSEQVPILQQSLIQPANYQQPANSPQGTTENPRTPSHVMFEIAPTLLLVLHTTATALMLLTLAATAENGITNAQLKNINDRQETDKKTRRKRKHEANAGASPPRAQRTVPNPAKARTSAKKSPIRRLVMIARDK